MKPVLLCAFTLAILTLLSRPALAADAAPTQASPQDLAKVVAELQKRVGELESTSKADKARIAQLEGATDEKKLAAQRRNDILEVLKEMNLDAKQRELKGKPVWSNLDVQLYGYIKADASYDTAAISNGNYARWVLPQNVNKNDSQFSMTARETRLGMKITGPSDNDIKTSGVVEIDFYGDGTENTPEPRMRHAYMVIDWPKQDFSLLAGQTWDVISPLNAPTLDYTVLWWAGNIGYRRPQIRATKVVHVTKDTSVKFEGAVARNIGHANAFAPLGDSGSDSGTPVVEGRTSVSFPSLAAGRQATVGVSGHYGSEQWDLNARGNHTDVSTWSANLDAEVPLCDWVSIKGEAFTGRNLDSFLGGIGQGIDIAGPRANGISDSGGWMALSLNPWKKWQFNFGAGVDSANNSDLNLASERTLNRVIFGNVIYAINSATSVGFEISDWVTDYRNQGNADALRFQTSFIYRF
ncbi:MAG: hypothetical protein LLG01_19285 [Planctomycetaceae bacterium]|nr:hypothetical protein [Planctomycetaceae bacterium]